MVSSSPHIRDNDSTRTIMADVLIALVPCVIMGTGLFGARSLAVVAVTAAAAILTEYISRIIMRREQTVGDFSAAVTGVILGLILPPGISFFIAAFGGVIAIAVIKQMFGGLGHNFANPACTARIVLLVSFSSMAVWSNTSLMGADAVTSATPLVSAGGTYSYLSLFLGNSGGSIGETSAAAILVGFFYLLWRKIITPVIPLAFVGSAFIMSFALGRDPLFEILAGGLMFGAVFMATDYSSSPISRPGKIVFGAGCGIITVIIRAFGSLPEGVSYSILIMNLIAPRLDSFFSPKPFGTRKRRTVK